MDFKNQPVGLECVLKEDRCIFEEGPFNHFLKSTNYNLTDKYNTKKRERDSQGISPPSLPD